MLIRMISKDIRIVIVVDIFSTGINQKEQDLK